MKDMSPVIVPRSDQISADDFIAGPRTYTISDVTITPGTEQPVQISLEGEQRAWKPCKSMSRCLVAAWGPDAKVYTGRSVTLYRDPKVKWGGMEVGGIRVSHMSHIDKDMMIQLTATKGKRAPHIVKPLAAEVTAHPAADPAVKWASGYKAKVESCTTAEELNNFANDKAKKLAELQGARPDLHLECVHALDNKRAALSFADDEHGGGGNNMIGDSFTDAADEFETDN